jgi:hypothetical protein
MVKSIASKMSLVARDAGYVQKDATNSFHRYKYATADAVYTKLRAALVEHGVGVIESVSELIGFHTLTDHKDKPKTLAVVKITQTFCDSDSGEVASYQGIGSGEDAGDKAVMKANTAALKYLMSAAFHISWGDDPEADRQVDERSSGRGEAPDTTAKTSARNTPPKPDGYDAWRGWYSGKAKKGEIENAKSQMSSKPEAITCYEYAKQFDSDFVRKCEVAA